MFSFFTKLLAIRDAIKLVAAGFPDVVKDVEILFGDVEAFIVSKAWDFAAINQAVADAESLYVAFVKDYTGSADQIKALITDLHALFA